MPGGNYTVRPEDCLEILEEAEEPFLSTGEIAERADVSRPTALDRLKELEEEGSIQRRMVAGNTPVWYLPDLENRRLSEYAGGVPETASDGAPTTTGNREERVREEAIKVVERFEEDLARVSSQALALARIDVEKHFKRLLITGSATVVIFILLLFHILFNFLPEWAFEWGALGFLAALIGLAWAGASAWYAYYSAEAEAVEEMSLQRDPHEE